MGSRQCLPSERILADLQYLPSMYAITKAIPGNPSYILRKAPPEGAGYEWLSSSRLSAPMGRISSGLTWIRDHMPASGLRVLSKDGGNPHHHGLCSIIADPSGSTQTLGLLSESQGGPPSASGNTGEP